MMALIFAKEGRKKKSNTPKNSNFSKSKKPLHLFWCSFGLGGGLCDKDTVSLQSFFTPTCNWTDAEFCCHESESRNMLTINEKGNISSVTNVMMRAKKKYPCEINASSFLILNPRKGRGRLEQLFWQYNLDAHGLSGTRARLVYSALVNWNKQFNCLSLFFSPLTCQLSQEKRLSIVLSSAPAVAVL